MESININDDLRWTIFHSSPNPKEYKGFKIKGSIKVNRTTGEGKITFSNGEQEFTVTGETSEDAYIKMFDTIDKFHNSKED